MPQNFEKSYELARQQYAELGVDTEAAMKRLRQVAISLHCWQGDDVGGFEQQGGDLGGGLAVTGNYPGKARTIAELRSDLEKVYSLLPGDHRLNLHAIYLDAEEKVERNQLEPKHFQSWIDWAKSWKLGMDFNPTFFSHPMADDGFTLAHRDEKVRQFWIEHGICCREIGAKIGAGLGSTCITNVWIPDGLKDTPADRRGPRERLNESLDKIFAKELNPQHNLDAVESKLFGIGSESYVVGSHEFYLGYAIRNNKVLCLDAGHFHPTETISDKISAVLASLDEILLHVSRGVRWDSDHVVIFNDDLRAITGEIVRGDYLDRVHIGLDFFDASINRIAAWVIGTRATLQGLLAALLEPQDKLRQYEDEGNFTARLALQEQLKQMPIGAVWDYYCEQSDTPAGLDWLAQVQKYERDVLSKR